MKTKLLHLATMINFMLIAFSTSAMAQRHLYNRVELGSGNLWTGLGAEVISAFINTAVHKTITEATIRYGFPSSEFGNLYSYQGEEDVHSSRFTNGEDYNTKFNGDFYGFKGRNLTSNILIGDKVGYLSDRQGFWNYCVYGAAYYNLMHLRVMQDMDDYDNAGIHRLQLGGGAMLIFGSIQRSGRVIIDAGLRYNIPLKATGSAVSGSTSDFLNGGLSSHYMVKYSFSNSVAIGVTFDLMHYNLFKDESICGNKSKLYELGFTVALMPSEL